MLKATLAERVKRSGEYRRRRQELQEAKAAQQASPKLVFVDEQETLGKDEIRRFTAARCGRGLGRRASSSGTTGEPFVFWQPLSALQFEQAYIDDIWATLGFTPRSKMAVLRGGIVPGLVGRTGRRLFISGVGWSPREIEVKYKALRDFGACFIHCYPSVLERFVAACREMGLQDFPAVHGIFAGSEAILPQHIELARDHFGARVVGWYGQSEQVCLAAMERPGVYAVVPEYSNVAFIKRGEALEIVGKSNANPLFSEGWYRTGDYCREVGIGWSNILNRNAIIMSGLYGRTPQFAISREGRSIPINHLVFGLHSARLDLIARYCLVHSAPGEMCLVWWNYSDTRKGVEEILRAVRQRFGKEFVFWEYFEPRLFEVAAPKWRYYFGNPAEFSEVTGIASKELPSRLAGRPGDRGS